MNKNCIVIAKDPMVETLWDNQLIIDWDDIEINKIMSQEEYQKVLVIIQDHSDDLSLAANKIEKIWK